MTVVGTAESEITPDTAVLRLGVASRGKQLVEVKATVDGLINSVTEEIVRASVEKDAIRTSSIDYSTYFSEDDDDYSDPIYSVERDISVTVPIAKVDLVLQNATKAGANQIREIRYFSSNGAEASRETLAAAIQNAKENAEFLATGFNANLGKVIKIQSDRSGYPSKLSLIVSAAQNPFGGEPYAPEDITVTRTITVVFELID